jgi:DNA-binding phage protein
VSRRQSSPRQAAADCINRALDKSDIAEICHAIGAATRLYNISDLVPKSGLARPSIHRAFAGDPTKPNFTTVLMFSMHVIAIIRSWHNAVRFGRAKRPVEGPGTTDRWDVFFARTNPI